MWYYVFDMITILYVNVMNHDENTFKNFFNENPSLFLDSDM